MKFSDYLNITDLNKFKSKSKEFFRIFEMLREKIIAEKFLDDLENNFGIYLDSENFVKELYNENDLSFMDKYNNLKKIWVILNIWKKYFSSILSRPI